MKRTLSLALLAVGIGVLAFVMGADAGDKNSTPKQEPSKATTGEHDMSDQNYKTAMFGAGCFWGVEASYRQVEGVKETAVGYAGGSVDNPTYKQVCYSGTGHAEVVRVIYDPSKVSYDDLLKVFWENHDPTQLNRQGPDVGDQYRSAIFYYDDDQKAAAMASKQTLDKSGDYKRPIVTQVESAPEFWMAEDYHQQYLEKRGLSTCRIK